MPWHSLGCVGILFKHGHYRKLSFSGWRQTFAASPMGLAFITEEERGPHPLVSSHSLFSFDFFPAVYVWLFWESGWGGVVFFRCLCYRWERIKRALKLREKELEMI